MSLALEQATVTAWATGALALLTAFYVWFTWRLSQESVRASSAAEEAAEHSRRAADAAEWSLLADSMPLVRPFVRRTLNGVPKLNVRNDGHDQALNLRLLDALDGTEKNRWPALIPRGPEQHWSHRVALR